MVRPRAVVIEPTRELSIQVLREARKLATGGVGGRGEDDQPAREWKIAVLGEEGVGVPVAAKKGRGKKKNKKGGQKGLDTKKKKEQEEAAAVEKAGTDDAANAESEAEEEDEGPTTTEAAAEDGDAPEQPYYGPVGE